MPSLSFPRVGRRVSICASALAVVSVAACSDTATAPRSDSAPQASPAVGAPNLGLGTNASPIMDGVMGPGEYTGAATTTFRIALPAPYGGTLVTVHAKRDKSNLYLATVYDRKSPVLNDQVVFEFDNDNDGVREDGDDMIGTNSSMPINLPLNVMDMFRIGADSSNHDDFDGGTRDVMSAWGSVGNTVVLEMSHALDSNDDAHDFSIDATAGAVTVGLQIMVQIQADPPSSGTWVNSFYPSPTAYCKLTIGKKTVSLAC